MSEIGEIPNPYTWGPGRRVAWFQKEARLRRAHIALHAIELKQPRPWWKLVWKLGLTVGIYGIFAVVEFSVFELVIRTPAFTVFFMFSFLGLLGVFLFAIGGFAWSSIHWDETPRAQVGTSPAWTWKGEPGEHVEVLALPEADRKNAPRSGIYLEFLQMGGAVDTPEWVSHRNGPVIVARCRQERRVTTKDEKDEELVWLRQSGFFDGRFYKIFCMGKKYLLGDLSNHRLTWYARKIRETFPGTVDDYTVVVIAIDPYDPWTWMPPPDVPGLERECYELRGRNKQVGRDMDNYTLDDNMREGRGA